MIEQTILQGLTEFHGALSGQPTSGAYDLQQRIEALTRDERTELQESLGDAVSSQAKEEEGRPSLNRALESMGRIEIARDWMRLYLEKHESSAAWVEASRKPSKGSAEYVCPRGDYRWEQPSASKPVPVCPIHNITLNKVP